MRPGHRRGARLQTRIFLWFIAAIVLALGAGAISVFLLHEPPPENPGGIVSRNVQARLSHGWDDPRATDAYVAELRDNTGLDMVLRRDVENLPAAVRHAPRRGSIVFEAGSGYIPVVRQGALVGALEVRQRRPRRAPWQLFLAVAVAVVVLGAASRRVSVRLSGPLVEIARAAERFGGGELTARTGFGGSSRHPRWVAEEVREVGRSFDSMADRIERMVLDQRELLAAISHELRSPLGRARVALEIAKERSPDASEKSLAVVEREIGNVDAILGDLLLAARAGLSDVRKERVAVVAWLEARLAADRDGLGEVKLDVEPEARAAELQADGPLLWRAVANLVRNARAHGHPADEPVRIAVRATGSTLTLEVSDSGPGFAADLLPRAFEPFVRRDAAARTPTSTKSTGLGLALVRRIAQAHGGSARAANRTDPDTGRVVGAVVTLDLPRA
ncbi:MAG: ATP-binding protein [Myxococcales bacterium]|nr:ATP-binding protein [Myxococcales bacterium]